MRAGWGKLEKSMTHQRKGIELAVGYMTLGFGERSRLDINICKSSDYG